MTRVLAIPAAVIFIGFLASLASCSRGTAIPVSGPQQYSGTLGSPLGELSSGLAYDTHIRVGKKAMSGIMYLRQMEKGIWRVAMTAKIGQTLFDFEIRPDTFIVLRSVDQINRRIVMKYLERDLRLLTEVYRDAVHVERLPNEPGMMHLRVKVPDRKGWRHLISHIQGNQVVEIAHGGKGRKKTTVRFSQYRDNIPYDIMIDHRTIISFEIQMHLVPTLQE